MREHTLYAEIRFGIAICSHSLMIFCECLCWIFFHTKWIWCDFFFSLFVLVRLLFGSFKVFFQFSPISFDYYDSFQTEFSVMECYINWIHWSIGQYDDKVSCYIWIWISISPGTAQIIYIDNCMKCLCEILTVTVWRLLYFFVSLFSASLKWFYCCCRCCLCHKCVFDFSRDRIF